MLYVLWAGGRNHNKVHCHCGSICFMFWSRIFVLFEPYVRFQIFISLRVTVRPPILK